MPGVYYFKPLEEDIVHFGVKGMKWGVRRYQNKDGSLTSAGKKRYSEPEKLAVLTKKGEIVDCHEQPQSGTAKFLAKFIPSIKKNQALYKDYTLKSKDGKTVGNLSTFQESPDSINIVWIGINSKSQGGGYGQSAMRTFIDHAKKSGNRHITLEVPTNSPNARHIYEKYGFKETGEKMIGDEDDTWGGLTKMRLDL